MKDKDISEFSQSVHKNTIWNILLRGIGILLGLVMLRINILYLGLPLWTLGYYSFYLAMGKYRRFRNW